MRTAYHLEYRARGHRDRINVHARGVVGSRERGSAREASQVTSLTEGEG